MPLVNNTPSVWDSVIQNIRAVDTEYPEKLIALMKERNEFGKNKYGTYVQIHNGRNSFNDAFQELLDAVVYLYQSYLETDSDEVYQIYWNILDNLTFMQEYADYMDNKNE